MTEVDKLPADFWKTGPLCVAHGGTASRFSCKACALALPPKLVLTAVWVPFEYRNPALHGEKKCMDLPRFASMEEVKDFIQFNSEALVRRYLTWQEVSDQWAIDEFTKGIGRLPHWKYGIPLRPDAPTVHPDLYEAIKRLSKPH